MDISTTIIELVGYVSLMLWGTHMTHTGIERAFGDRLRRLLTYSCKGRFVPFLVGFTTTTILQSSTVMGLMATEFASRGILKMVPGLAMMLGANVGSTIIVQMLSFDIAAFSPILLISGLMAMRQSRSRTSRNVGRSLLGLGLLLLAIHRIGLSLANFDEDPGIALIFGAVARSTSIAFLSALVVTWLAHSSVAIVLVIATLANKGLFPPISALAMVLGANIGSVLNPLLEGTTSLNPASYRLPLGNLFIRLLGAMTALVFLPWISDWLVILQPNAAFATVDFHTGFNILIAILATPFLAPIARMLERKLPSGDSSQRPRKLTGIRRQRFEVQRTYVRKMISSERKHGGKT